jgi:hypothetical protein
MMKNEARGQGVDGDARFPPVCVAHDVVHHGYVHLGRAGAAGQIVFALIWSGIVVYSADSFVFGKKIPASPKSSAGIKISL